MRWSDTLISEQTLSDDSLISPPRGFMGHQYAEEDYIREIKRVHICTLPTDIVTPGTDAAELSQLTIYSALELCLCPPSVLNNPHILFWYCVWERREKFFSFHIQTCVIIVDNSFSEPVLTHLAWCVCLCTPVYPSRMSHLTKELHSILEQNKTMWTSVKSELVKDIWCFDL